LATGVSFVSRLHTGCCENSGFVGSCAGHVLKCVALSVNMLVAGGIHQMSDTKLFRINGESVTPLEVSAITSKLFSDACLMKTGLRLE